MDKDELKKVQLAIHDLITKEQYDLAMPLINEVLMVYPNDAFIMWLGSLSDFKDSARESIVWHLL